MSTNVEILLITNPRDQETVALVNEALRVVTGLTLDCRSSTELFQIHAFERNDDWMTSAEFATELRENVNAAPWVCPGSVVLIVRESCRGTEDGVLQDLMTMAPARKALPQRLVYSKPRSDL